MLIWDPDPGRLQLITRVASDHGFTPRVISGISLTQRMEIVSSGRIALVALHDVNDPASETLVGIRLLKQREFHVVCYEEGTGSWPLGLRCRALLAGALRILDSAESEFVTELGQLLRHLAKAEADKVSEERRLQHVMSDLGLIGTSPAMLTVFRWVTRVSALSDLPALITGETGTGKQLVAEAIHHLDSKRCKGPFVTVNCGAISPTLAETELFGHRRGAYTGADRDRRGLIRSAQGGTLFLDEIGELEESLQTKLLRVLQDARVLAVGEDREVPIDVRVIAATNRDLHGLVQQNKFRVDLLHRLKVLSICLPSLRERRQDVKPLVEHFMKKYRGLINGTILSVEPDVVEALAQVTLPGNVRELENLLRSVLVEKNDGSSLSLSDLPAEVWQQVSDRLEIQRAPTGLTDDDNSSSEGPSLSQNATSAIPDPPPMFVDMLKRNGWNLPRSLRQCEKSLLHIVWYAANGNQSRMARMLGITPRSVYNKVRKYGLQL